MQRNNKEIDELTREITDKETKLKNMLKNNLINRRGKLDEQEKIQLLLIKQNELEAYVKVIKAEKGKDIK